MTVGHGGVAAIAATASGATADHSVEAALILAVMSFIGVMAAPILSDAMKRRFGKNEPSVYDVLREDLKRRDEELAYKDATIMNRDRRIDELSAECDRLRRRR